MKQISTLRLRTPGWAITHERRERERVRRGESRRDLDRLLLDVVDDRYDLFSSRREYTRCRNMVIHNMKENISTREFVALFRASAKTHSYGITGPLGKVFTFGARAYDEFAAVLQDLIKQGKPW